MKKENGFTIIEIIIVIVITVLIAGLSIGIFTNLQEKNKEKLHKTKIKLIETNADKWAESVNLTTPITITVNKLVETGFLDSDNDSGEVLSLIDNTVMNCHIINIEFDKNQANAEYSAQDQCGLVEQEKNDNNIIINAYSLINGTEKEKIVEEKTGLLKWSGNDVRLKLTVLNNIKYTKIRWYQNGNLIDTDNMQTFLDVKASLFLNSSFKVAIETEEGTKVSTIQVRIDKEAPVIIKINWNRSWENTTTKKVTVNVSDGSGSGIESYYINSQNTIPANANWISTKDTINVNAPKGTSYIWVKDAVGNISKVESYVITTLDTVPPTITTPFISINSSYGNTFYNSLTRRGSASDIESGLAYIKYCITTASTCTPNTNVNIVNGIKVSIFDMIFSTSGILPQKACVQAQDLAGNKTAVICDSKFLIDKTPPTGVEMSFRSDIVGINPGLSTGMRVTITAKDNESGIWKYVCEYGKTTDFGSSVTLVTTSTTAICNLYQIRSGTYVRVTVYNNAGLVTTTETKSIVNYIIPSNKKCGCASRPGGGGTCKKSNCNK